MNGVARWGRCNGWVALAQAELLNNLPANHPKRPELIKLLLRQIVGFSRYQDTSGMWHQVLDKPESYLESSVTAMFVYTVAKAVNEGWISKRFITIAQKAGKRWQKNNSRRTSAGYLHRHFGGRRYQLLFHPSERSKRHTWPRCFFNGRCRNDKSKG